MGNYIHNLFLIVELFTEKQFGMFKCGITLICQVM